MEAKLLSSGIHHPTLPPSYVRLESDRPRLSQVSACHGVPVIDLSSPDTPQIVCQISEACRSYGFFQVINHEVDLESVKKMSEVTYEFFRLPVEEKMKLFSDDLSKTMRLSTSFNVNKEKVDNWRDYLRLNCYPMDLHVPECPSNTSFRFQLSAMDSVLTIIVKNRVTESVLTCQYIHNLKPYIHCVKLNPTVAPAVSSGMYVLGQDLFYYLQTSQVSQKLSNHLTSSEATQAIWFRKLVNAWKESKQIPQTPEEVSKLVIEALKGHENAEVEELLGFYGLPQLRTLNEPSDKSSHKSLPKWVQYELLTLPVHSKAIADGDTLTVYVRVSEPNESVHSVPDRVCETYNQRKEARALRNYKKADALHKEIIDQGYRVIKLQHVEVLARKYRIRLRGIDAPETEMPYGKEATDELRKIVEGETLKVLVYENDCYGRFVGDIYCNDIFVQELMLKKGFAWHYDKYDKRVELKTWEEEARRKRVGLWASSNPEKPWKWREKHRRNKILSPIKMDQHTK